MQQYMKQLMCVLRKYLSSASRWHLCHFHDLFGNYVGFIQHSVPTQQSYFLQVKVPPVSIMLSSHRLICANIIKRDAALSQPQQHCVLIVCVNTKLSGDNIEYSVCALPVGHLMIIPTYIMDIYTLLQVKRDCITSDLVHFVTHTCMRLY